MKIDTLNEILEKNNKSYLKNFNINPIGLLIKKKRLERNLTLKEVSQFICSISYLSKIETCSILPNTECLRLIMERLNISKSEIIILENSKELFDKSIQLFYHLNYKEYENLFEMVKDIEKNVTASIIRIGYYVMLKEYNLAKEDVEYCLDSVSSMNEETMRVLSLYIAEYELGIGKTSKIEKTLVNLLGKHDDLMFTAMVNDCYFRYCIHENKVAQATKCYSDLMKIYSDFGNLDRIYTTRMQYLSLLYYEGEYESIVSQWINSSTILLNDGNNSDLINSIIGISLYKTKRFIEAKSYFDMIDMNSKLFPKVVAYKFHYASDKIEFIEEIKRLNQDENNFFLSHFIQAQEKNLSTSLFNSLGFAEALSGATKKEKIELLTLKKNYLASISKYKEAYKVSVIIDSLND